MERGACKLNQFDQVLQARLRVVAVVGGQQLAHGCVVEANATRVDDQLDGIQVGAQPGLQRQRPVHRRGQRFVGGVEQRGLVLGQADGAQPCPRWGHDAPSAASTARAAAATTNGADLNDVDQVAAIKRLQHTQAPKQFMAGCGQALGWAAVGSGVELAVRRGQFHVDVATLPTRRLHAYALKAERARRGVLRHQAGAHFYGQTQGVGVRRHPVGGLRIRARPGLQQAIQQRPLGVAVGCRGQLADLALQAAALRCAQAHGLAQVAQPTAAAHLGRLAGGRCVGDDIGELAVKRVAAQVQVARAQVDAVHVGGAAVHTGDHCGAGDGVAVAQVGVDRGGVQRNRSDARCCQRLQFSGLADAVAVQVAPDAHVGKLRVAGVEDAVAVAGRADGAVAGVQAPQGIKAVGGVARHADGRAVVVVGANGDQRVHPKQLAAGIDGAVAVAVQHQPGVVGAQPAGASADAVGVVVEEGGDAVVDDGGGFDAVAVEVDGQGVAGAGLEGVAPVAV